MFPGSLLCFEPLGIVLTAGPGKIIPRAIWHCTSLILCVHMHVISCILITDVSII